MATTISRDSFTLRQIFLLTYNQKRSRFEYKERDVLKTLRIVEVYRYKRDRTLSPTKKFRIYSFSYPQYKPYINVKGKKSKKQRKIKHQYLITLELESLDFDAKFKWRTGSQRKWDPKPPQKKIKSLYMKTREAWKKKYPDPVERKKVIKRHKESAPYLDVGDYNSQVRGLMGDFYFRIMGNLYAQGMLFGRNWATDLPDEKYIFFDKHVLGVVMYLLRTGKISF